MAERTGVEVQISGHKATIVRVSAAPKRPLGPLEDKLSVMLDFDPHVDGIMGTAILVPVSSALSPEAFLAAVVTEGSLQFGETLARHRKEREDRLAFDQRERELKDVARKVSEDLGLEFTPAE